MADATGKYSPVTLSDPAFRMAHPASESMNRTAEQSTPLPSPSTTKPTINPTTNTGTKTITTQMSNIIKAKHKQQASRAAKHNAEQALSPHPNAPRRIATRSRTAQFPFLRLPAELRNKIYSYALAEPQQLALTHLKIPPLLQTTRQLRREALGLFTSVNEITLNIRSTYCVVGRHVAAHKMHKFYRDTGLLTLDGERRAWIQKQGVVFAKLEIVVWCCCCASTRIGTFRFRVREGGKCTLSSDVYPVRDPVGLDRVIVGIGERAWEVVLEAMAREGFVGLILGELERVAACFRWGEVVELD